jgi:hypothetical protein
MPASPFSTKIGTSPLALIEGHRSPAGFVFFDEAIFVPQSPSKVFGWSYVSLVFYVSGDDELGLACQDPGHLLDRIDTERVRKLIAKMVFR